MSLIISNVSKQFGRFPALNDISLSAQHGEFLALLGPSGSGKTTLLRVIAGLETPDAGAVIFAGENLLAKPVRMRGIGFVFQHYALFRHMRVRDNIAFGMRAKKRSLRPSTSEIQNKVNQLLGMMQLDGLGHRFPSQLSGGQRQRVALARALAIEPKLLLLDEPFGALDAKVRRDLRRWLRDLHERTGLTTIFVTHDQEEALELADRVAVLRNGSLEQVGTPGELYHAPATGFVFDFLGDTIQLPCEVQADRAIIYGATIPIIGPPQQGPCTAYVRPDQFQIRALAADQPLQVGFRAEIRNLILVGPDARFDCLLPDGNAIEIRVPHEIAGNFQARQAVEIWPNHVRVWARN